MSVESRTDREREHTERDWKALPVERVSIVTIRPEKLVPAWWKLAKVLLVMAHILKPRNGDYVPHLVQLDRAVGSYVIEDGHHRINVSSLVGRRSILARVYRLPNGTPSTERQEPPK